MKVVIATLLFISAAEAIRNLVGLPEEKSSRLHHLLKGTNRAGFFKVRLSSIKLTFLWGFLFILSDLQFKDKTHEVKQILIREKSMIALTFNLFNLISYNPTQFSKITLAI